MLIYSGVFDILFFMTEGDRLPDGFQEGATGYITGDFIGKGIKVWVYESLGSYGTHVIMFPRRVYGVGEDYLRRRVESHFHGIEAAGIVSEILAESGEKTSIHVPKAFYGSGIELARVAAPHLRGEEDAIVVDRIPVEVEKVSVEGSHGLPQLVGVRMLKAYLLFLDQLHEKKRLFADNKPGSLGYIYDGSTGDLEVWVVDPGEIVDFEKFAKLQDRKYYESVKDEEVTKELLWSWERTKSVGSVIGSLSGSEWMASRKFNSASQAVQVFSNCLRHPGVLDVLDS